MCYPALMDRAAAHSIVSSFNDCISRSDIDGLSKLMTGDHVFIDTAGNTISGKERCIVAWTSFFVAFPDYRNTFEQVLWSGDKAAIVGRSICSDARLAGPALWTARIEGTLIAEWRVYEDTRANRTLLGLAE